MNYFLHFVSSFIIILYCFDKVKILNDLDELVANLLKENNKKNKDHQRMEREKFEV